MKLDDHDRIYLPAFALLVVLYLSGLLFDPDAILFTEARGPQMDLIQQYYPWRHYLNAGLAEGRLPVWNPHTFLGQPFVANIQVGVFSPLYLPLLVLPLHVGYSYTILLVMLLGGVGTYALLRTYGHSGPARFVGAVAFAFGTAMTARLSAGHVTIMATYALVPWVFLAVERALWRDPLRAGSVVGAVAAVQFLSGHPQTTHMTLGAVFVYALVRRLAAAGRDRDELLAAGRQVGAVFLVAGVVAFLLSAVQFLPSLHMIQYGTRDALELREVTGSVLTPTHLFEFVTPNIEAGMTTLLWERYVPSFYWEKSFYPGVFPVVLAAATLDRVRSDGRVAALVLVGSGAFVLALGPVTPAYFLYFEFVPGANLARVPVRFTMLLAFSIAVLAGIGYDIVTDLREPLGRAARRVPVGLAGLAALMAVGVVVGIDAETTVLNPRVMLLESGLAVLLVLVSIGLIQAYRRELAPERYLRGAMLALVVGNLLFYTVPLVESKPVDEAFERPDVPETDGRVYDMAKSSGDPGGGIQGYLRYETNVVHGITVAKGYNPQVLTHSLRPMAGLHRQPATYDRRLDALNVTHVVAYTDFRSTVDAARLRNDSGYRLVARDDNPVRNITSGRTETRTITAYVFENERTLPLAYSIPAAGEQSNRTSSSATPVPAGTATADGDRAAAAADQHPDALESVDTANGLSVRRDRPSRLVVTGPVERPGYVVVAQSWHPFWRAQVDGETTPVVRTENGLSAVPVDAGAERVVLTYRSWPVRVGAVCSIVGLCWLGYVLVRRRPEPAETERPPGSA